MAVTKVCDVTDTKANGSTYTALPKSVVIHRDLGHQFPKVIRAEGLHWVLEDGRRILDASGGASVGCLGWGNERVASAVTKQILAAPYCPTMFYTTSVYEELAQELIDGSDGRMARAYIVNSGSEAMEAAVKLARQYFLELSPAQPQRVRFVSRHQSYHGTTLGALAISGHAYRRAKFEPLFTDKVSKVSPCYEYRGKKPNETRKEYVDRLAQELDDEFQRLGPDTVCAFVAEPVVGATLGCVPFVEGYLEAVQAVCQRHGALLILDEVMCGMGRCGTLHTWQQTGAVPDIQTIGKGLGGGYQAVAGVLANHGVVNALEKGTSVFVHGHTYQGHPAGCAAALEVQRIIREDALLANVRAMGALLSQRLSDRLAGHPHVGNIRGAGLFWGIEFVADKATAKPFPAEEHVAMEMAALGLAKPYSINVYPGSGTVDGLRGDHVIMSPAYNITSAGVEEMASIIASLVGDYFAAKRMA